MELKDILDPEEYKAIQWGIENRNVETGLKSINDIVNKVALPWMNMKDVKNEFSKVFKESSKDLIKHLISKWDNDFARFYLNMDQTIKRQLFTYYKIPLEKDKFENSMNLNLALIKGISRWEAFPYESQIVNQFYLMANNNSLQLLQKITTGGYEIVLENKIELFGNGLNWSKAWVVLSEEQRVEIIKHLLITKF